MVTEKSVEVFRCAYCDEVHEDWDGAVNCDCREPPKEEEKSVFVCDLCKTEHEDEEDAQDCEARHEEDQDKWFLKRQQEEEQKRLLVIANHPSQRRLPQ